MGDAGDITLASYEAGANLYAARPYVMGEAMARYLARIAKLVEGGTILELGSGPGRDAEYLETFGVSVTRTDGALAFVEMMRAQGFTAEVLDMRTEQFNGTYDAVVANAVLLHLRRDEFEVVARKSRGVVSVEGLLAFTVKKGDGTSWSNAKLGLPRHYTYWQDSQLRQVLGSTGWETLSIETVVGSTADWLFVIARAN
ncbi:SAM-dependent methyltransferase [Rhodococcus sp. IEGM 1318]|uniref:SAM-dependent methyltransferase n=1 Tax=Rhodococcus sp. IEGM 1318 TaxID=3082226 RepID=UPI00295358CD|nr:methyltransferase domain-containing protein [Rhodococcus sp. IEGM 1318]MDV8007125.1 methyltransferase domain-containing protein [Rhodococcus sp. IEGM 1318]